MKLGVRIVAFAFAWAVVAAPLGAQKREFVVAVYGGGSDHLKDLSGDPAASFSPGYNVGGRVSMVINRNFAVRGDFTYARNPSWGASSFAGNDVNRFYVSVEAEGRYPLQHGWTPFAFLGLGTATMDQLGVDQFKPFTKAAITIGGGMSYAIGHTPFEGFAEVKGITYRWDQAGFDTMMLDVTYSLGLGYHLSF